MLVDNSSLLDEKPLLDQLSDYLILNFFRFSTEVGERLFYPHFLQRRCAYEALKIGVLPRLF